MIKQIELENFKSFRELKLKLKPFNVVIGPNAAGKSNFVNFFKFLKNIANDGLENAISLQGGPEYLTNLNTGISRPLKIKIETDLVFDNALNRIYALENYKYWKTFKQLYELEVELSQAGIKNLRTDKVTIIGNTDEDKNDITEDNLIQYSNVNGKIMENSKLNVFIDPLSRILLNNIGTNEVLLQRDAGLLFYITRFFKNIQAFNFEPSALKRISSFSSKKDLEEDGSNIAVVLNNIFKNKADKTNFLILLRDILKFVDGVSVGKYLEKSLIVNLKEKYLSDRDMPSFLLSEGTMYITALITSLYYTDKALLLFEEVDKSIHPYIISRLIQMMKEVSKEKQIILTTHNPEVLKHVELDDILLITRNENGYSEIIRPIERQDVKIFLQNNIGISNLFEDGILK